MILQYLGYAGIVPCLVDLLNEYISINQYHHECGKEDSNPTNNASIDGSDTKAEKCKKELSNNQNSVIIDVGDILEFDQYSESGDVRNEMNESLENTSIEEVLSPTRKNDSRNDDNSSSSLVEEDECDNHSQKVDCILQILLRLCDVLPLSDSLTDINTVKAVVRYVCWTKYDPTTHRRAGHILLRMSKRIESIMPCLTQAFFPWLRLELDKRLQNSDLRSCLGCQTFNNLFTSIYQTFIFTAESGYIEGNVCHTLVAPGAANEINRSVITVGIVSLITCKTLIYNILVTHGGLEVILQTLEHQATMSENSDLFSHAVLSLNLLAHCVDVVSSIDDRPLKLDKCQQTEDVTQDTATVNTRSSKRTIQNESSSKVIRDNVCFYKECVEEKNLALIFDDGSRIMVNKKTIVSASNVFDAMLSGRFLEASQNEVSLPKTSASAMLRIVHYLYGCRRWAGKDGCCRYSVHQEDKFFRTSLKDSSHPAKEYEDDLEMLLDLVPLSDKYLLTDISIIVCRMIVEQCTQNPEGKMKIAYKRSLNIVCPTTNNIKDKGVQKNNQATVSINDNVICSSTSLNVQLVAFLLAGNIRHQIRVKLFRELVKSDSEVSSDFVDDISQIITSCLKAALKKPKPIIARQNSANMKSIHTNVIFRPS